MKETIDSLLNTCLEIEGLLCLISRRYDAYPPNVISLLKRKAAQLNAEVECIIDTSDNDFEPQIASPSEEQMVRDLSLDVPDASGELLSIPIIPTSEEIHNEDDIVDLSADSQSQSDVGNMDRDTDVENTSAVKPIVNDKMTIELTINDKFRFRRELFNNSDAEMNEALKIAAEMGSIEEVEDLFYNDYCFDPEAEVVKDFMHIVTSRF